MSSGGFFAGISRFFGLDGPAPIQPARLQRRIDTLERQVEFLARHLDIDPRRLPQAPPACSPEVVQLVRNGQKIQAIKLHREQTGLGLAEAKHDVDEIG